MKHIVLVIGSILLTTACGGKVEDVSLGDSGQITSIGGGVSTASGTDDQSTITTGGTAAQDTGHRLGDTSKITTETDMLLSIGIEEEDVGGCPAGQKTCHDCKALDTKYPVTLPWGENYALAGTADNLHFFFIQNEGGEWNPAVLRSYGFAGSPVIQPTALPASNWQASVFSSESGFVVTTMEHSQNPGTLITFDRYGNEKKRMSTNFSSGAEGQNGIGLFINSSINESSTEVTHGIQLIDANGDFAQRVPVSTVRYNEDGIYVSYPYVNRPSMVGDTVAVPHGILYFEGALKDKSRSRFDIAKIDGSGTISANIDETAGLNASWSIGNSYFLWSTRADEGESIYRIQKDGTVASRFMLDERPSLVVKRPSGFATLVRENLSLYRYTWGGKLLSANMLLPGKIRDDSEIALTAGDDKHFVVAVSDKAQNATNLYFVVCE